MKLIDKDILVAEIVRRISNLEELGNRLFIQTNFPEQYRLIHGYESILSFLDTIPVKEVDFEHENEHPEPYFYCKYGGTMSLCSDCKINHNNSPFKTEEITTWYVPSNGTKCCIDYIQQEQSEMDLEKEIGKYLDVNNIEYGFQVKLFDFAKHFFELGIKTQKGE